MKVNDTIFNIGDVKFPVIWSQSEVQFKCPCDVCKGTGKLRSPSREITFKCPSCGGEGHFTEMSYLYEVGAPRAISSIKITLLLSGTFTEEYNLSGYHYHVESIFDTKEEAEACAEQRNNKLKAGIEAQYPGAQLVKITE